MSTPQEDAQTYWDLLAPATFTTYVPGVGEFPGTPVSQMMPDWSQLEAKIGALIQSVVDLYGPNAQVTAVMARSLTPPTPPSPRGDPPKKSPTACQVMVNCRPAAS